MNKNKQVIFVDHKHPLCSHDKEYANYNIDDLFIEAVYCEHCETAWFIRKPVKIEYE
jgi:hypothetical protein